MGKEAQGQPALFNDHDETSVAGADAKPQRRRHVVIPKKIYNPAQPASASPTALDRLKRVINIELPMIWVVLGSVGLVALLGMIFLLGQHRGMKQGRQATLDRLRGTQITVGMASDVNKPLVETQADVDGLSVSPAIPNAKAGAVNTAAGPTSQPVNKPVISAHKPTEGTSAALPARPASETVDKRKPGLNYLVLAMYNQSEAERLIAFLKQRGVEAQAIPVHNGRLFCVIALRGFDAPSLRTTYPAFKQQINALGREWNTRHKGPTNLSDAWPQRYDG